MNKILHFTDLIVWQKGHKLVIQVYFCVEKFPEHERFGLSSQLSRSVVSVTSNIAEGFGRRTKREKVRYYDIALGSLYEVQNQLLVAKDVHYISEQEFQKTNELAKEVEKLLNSIIISIKKRS
ncbi:four helix bundle protein [Candidatus Uhrbacteria bacterium]|nr:four helix bundle protein [Candidatus Uhrbacteria bacterium]